MQDPRMRPEFDAPGLVLQDQVPYDLTKFKQQVRLQDFPLTEYVVNTGQRVMEITISDDTKYLNDVEFWAYIIKRNAAGVYEEVKDAGTSTWLTETVQLIDSIEI